MQSQNRSMGLVANAIWRRANFACWVNNVPSRSFGRALMSTDALRRNPSVNLGLCRTAWPLALTMYKSIRPAERCAVSQKYSCKIALSD
jgi:hypothetical protein